MNTSLLLLFVCVIAYIRGNEDYSNSANLESVTTFYDCSASSDANIPADLKDTVCNGAAPITVIRYIARPGENDIAADKFMAFYTFPQPFEEQPINQQTENPPSNNPCAQVDGTTPCSVFTANGATGPITIQVTASNVIRKYFLKPVLDRLQVPYSYVNYDAKVPRCDPTKYCENKCDKSIGSRATGDQCDPGAKDNIETSFFACCSVHNDYEPNECTVGGGFVNPIAGSVYNQINSFYDYGDNCGTADSELIYNYGNDYGEIESNSPDCRSCSKIYGLHPKKEVANIGINWKNDDPSDDVTVHKCPTQNKGKDANYMDVATFDYPRLMPDLCPIGVTHSDAYPVTEGNRNSYQHGNPDAYAMEPYYYWCQSMCVGTDSYTPKRIYFTTKSEDAKSNQCGAQVGPFSEINYETDGGGKIGFKQRGNLGTPDQDYSDHWLQAYSCQLMGDMCAALIWARSVDGGGYPCCNSTFDADGEFADDCGAHETEVRDCGGMAVKQVEGAVSYLTAACDADESGEILQGGKSTYADGASDYTGQGWKCPGWDQDFIRPANNPSPMTTASQTPGLAVAKCSGECQADPFIRWSETSGNNQCKSSHCRTPLQSVTTQKAAIGMAGAACRVYQVVPEPIVDISLVITYTAPDGSVVTSRLATDGSSVAQATVLVINSTFTTRINQIFVRGGAGPQIPGYIVICGTDEPKQDFETACISKKTATQYNPYDPPNYPDDEDISVPHPFETGPNGETNYCTSSEQGIGTLRGVFPEPTATGDVTTGPTKNPWPQLIRKMVQSRTLNEKATTAETDANPFFSDFQTEATACHAPTPKYLGVLNCGRPVYWYYVSPERKTSYGTGCGQVGIQNSFPLSEAGRRQMCLQEDNSCTPGYGIGKVTASNAPFFRTPCQELGDYIKSTAPTFDSGGHPLPCSASNIPLGLRMPGFQYIQGSYDEGGDQAMIPNTWVDGQFLYQEMLTNEQQNINVDLSTYTDTFFGGNYQTYSPGKLVVVSNSTNICTATANTETGVLTMGALNTNKIDGGSYTMTVSCFDPVSNQPLNPQSMEGITVGGTSTISDFPLGPLEQKNFTFSIFASGNVAPSPTPTPGPISTDSDSDSDPATDIGFPNCMVTLLHSAGDATPLDAVTVDCTLYALQVLVNDKVTVIDDIVQFRETCADWFILTRPFCFLANEGPFETWLLIFLIMVGAIMMWWVFSMVVRSYYLQIEVEKEIKSFKIDLARTQRAKSEKQAILIEKVVTANLSKPQTNRMQPLDSLSRV